MNKKLSILTVGAAAFILGMSANNFAISNGLSNFNLATVDVQKVVANSAQVNSLKEEQKQKRTDLVEFVKKARTDVAKESDKTKKSALEAKYNKQLNDMKNSIDTDYQKKLKDIDNSISKTIQAQARKDNYDVVLSKGIVLYGGTDITDEITQLVK